jgi:hypothetical protein
MSGFQRLFGVLLGAGVLPLLQAKPACAQETTRRGVSSTVYAGAGGLAEPNNEVGPDQYDVKRVGVGALGVWRFASEEREPREPGEERGFFAALGAGFELEDSILQGCNGSDFSCFGGGAVNQHYLGKHVAARLGVGYSWPIFEFRVGALASLPDAHVRYAQPVALPDVQLRLGNRDVGWFELGLGAYDASTNLRPGVYLGGAVGTERQLRISAHLGIHFVNGLCCSTVVMVGSRYELGASRAVTDSISVGLGVALLSDLSNEDSHYVGEGSARIALRY